MEDEVKTNVEWVKRDLLKGVEITSLDGLKIYHTMDMRKVLSILRLEHNMPISFRWETNATTGKRYKVHFIKREDRVAWGEKHLVQTNIKF